MSSQGNRVHAELLMLYTNVVEHIELMKQRHGTWFTSILVSKRTVALIFRTDSLIPGAGIVTVLLLTGIRCGWTANDRSQMGGTSSRACRLGPLGPGVAACRRAHE